MVAELKERFDREELEKRTHSLHACALVARSWVTRSGLHLFCCIALGSDLRTRRFLSSLTLSPYLGKFVETLQMRPNNDDERSCGWIFRALSTLPPLLPHLRELAFFELPDLHPACFALLSRFRTVQSVILRWLNRQSLREITQLLSWFPQLRRLHVQFCEWKLPGRYYSGKQHKVIALDVNLSPTDRVRGMSLLEWAMASGLTGTLASLRVSSNVAGSVLDRLLETCSTLRELHFDLWEQDGEWLWIAILANAYLSESQNMKFPFLQAILQVISELLRLPLFAPNSLISIWVDPVFRPKMGSLKEVSKSQWKAVDLALCNPKFPHLKSVEFSESSEEPIENPDTFFHQVLPKSYERGILWYRSDRKGM